MIIKAAKILFVFVLILFSKEKLTTNYDSTVVYKVLVKHIGISNVEPQERTLYRMAESDSLWVYYMNVESVVCGDSKCKIDTVRIYWNDIGEFTKLVLPKGVHLEKSEGKYFTDEDYTKLNKILSDKNSGLKHVYKQEVVGSSSGDGVDAVSGATVKVHVDDYVKGAVWTTYSLWHWANGDIFDVIRSITADSLSTEKLLHRFNEGYTVQNFVIEQLGRREYYKGDAIELILSKVKKYDYNQHKLVLEYLEKADSDIYFPTFYLLFQEVPFVHRILYLNALKNSKYKYPQNIFREILIKVIEQDSYNELNFTLDLIESKVDPVNDEIINIVLPLLENQNFVIARRSYWFLKGKTLNEKQKKKIETFHTKYAVKL